SMAPYGAGGIRCCYEVPKQWHEGLMVEVETYYPLVGDTIEERSEDLGQREATGTVTEKVKLPVPEYQAPAAGTLWVQFMPDRNIKVVVSDLSPDHEDFPGDVKGWPVPSDEYRRQKIDQKINFLENSKKNQQEDLNELKRNPDTVLKSYWNIFSDIKHMSKEINIFSDYQDPRFNDFMKSYLKAGIAGDDRKIDIYKRSRP
ncbi:DUF3304 domain-containing protein, partial [Cobetia sp. MMG027]|uniref:DUF3304 domain-containing protein n=1 Tax=Cobetia sp. MMG027 TaxID=3021980 RepID=UPI0022FEAF43